MLRYKVPDFEKLTPQQRILIYYLTEAALTGRDILWDQNGKYNLAIRDLIENVYKSYEGGRSLRSFPVSSLQRMSPNFPLTNSLKTSTRSMR